MATQTKLPNFNAVSQSTVKAYILPVLKRTAATLKFNYRFQFWPIHHHRYHERSSWRNVARLERRNAI